MSLAFEAASGRWMVKAWVRNLTNPDNVNNTEFLSGSIGGGRLVTLNDPRLYGATVRVNVGI